MQPNLPKDDEDNQPTLQPFTPLSSKLSLSISDQPNPSLEVLPTADLERLHEARKKRMSESGVVQRNQQQYGAPKASLLNTRHVGGREIDPRHEQYAISLGMMMGLRECVGGMGVAVYELNEKLADVDFLSTTPGDENVDNEPGEEGSDSSKGLDKSIYGGMEHTRLKEECARVQKYKFPKGSCVTSSSEIIPYRYKFKAYAPLVFAKIRGSFGVHKQKFLHSICGKDNLVEFMSNAKSGQFFFYSHDGRYMIKTHTRDEFRFLLQILPHYYTYIRSNPHTFLTHFYGMYRVQIPDLGNKAIHFIVMKSVFNTDCEIHTIWDLKGSTLGRRSSRGDSVRKDLDIIDEARTIQLGKEKKKVIMAQMKKDALFLASLEIMDYSMLMGVHLRTTTSKGEEKNDCNNKHAVDVVNCTNTPYRRKFSMVFGNKKVTSERDDALKKGNEKDTHDTDSYLEPMDESIESSSDEGLAVTQKGAATNTANSLCTLKRLFNKKKPSPLVKAASFTTLGNIAKSIPTDRNRMSSTAHSTQNLLSVKSQDDSLSSNICYQDEGLRINNNTLHSSPIYSNANIKHCPYSNRDDLGIESVSKDERNESHKEIFFLGIIDILQHYNARKWGETIIKKAVGNSSSSISCVDPTTYADRFVNFMGSLIE